MNPYLKKHRKKLKKEEEQRQRYLKSRDQRKGLKTAGVIAGAVAITHFAHPKGIIGAADDIGRGISSAAQALKETRRSVKIHRMEAGKEVARDLSPYTFKENFKRAWEEKGKTVSDNIRIEKIRQTLEEGKFDSDLRRLVLEQKRYNTVQEKIQDVAGEVGEEKIQSFLKNYQHQLGKLPIQEAKVIERKLRKSGFESPEDINKIRKLITSTKAEVSVTDEELGSVGKEFKDKIIENIIKQRQHEDLSGQPRRAVKEKLTDSALDVFNYRRATIEDIQNLPLEKGIEIKQETFDYLERLKELGADPHEFIPDDQLLVHKGEIISAHSAHKAKEHLRETFSEGLLGRILYQRDSIFLDDFAKKPYHIMRPGRHQPTLEDLDVVGDDYVLHKGLMGIGDKIYGLDDPRQALREGVVFTSGKYGSAKRLLAQMADINRFEDDRSGLLHSIGKKLGLERHQEPGHRKKLTSFLFKKKDPEWMPNKIATAFSDDLDEDLAYELYDYMRVNAPALDAETLDLLTTITKDPDIKELKFKTGEDLHSAFKTLAQKTGRADTFYGSIEEQIKNIKNHTIQQTRKGIGQKNYLLTGEEALQREIGRELFDYAYQKEGLISFYNKFQKVSPLMGSEEIAKTKIAFADKSLGFAAETSGLKYNEPLKKVFDLTDKDELSKITAEGLGELAQITHPDFGMGPLPEFKGHFHSDVIPLKQFDFSIGDIKGTFTAGKDNFQDVHRGTLLSYGISTRMNDILRGVDWFTPFSLGLPDRDLGSTMQFAGNAMMKRVLPVVAGYNAVRYMSDHAKERSGYTYQQRFERAKAHTRLQTARFKDATPIGSLMQNLDTVTPGSEGISSVFHSVPFVGWGASFTGLFSPKTEGDWIDYYESGRDPVRRGRWWPLGSTPWMGQDITHFEPNAYQQAMSEWQYTDTLYGSREEYWENHWMPTPRYPLAPIRNFITNRYWLEEKHKERRPYPISTGLFDDQTPWGMILNPTIGQILKPQKDYGAGASPGSLEEIHEEAMEEERLLTRFAGGQIENLRLYPDQIKEKELGSYTTTYPGETGATIKGEGSDKGESSEGQVLPGNLLATQSLETSEIIKAINTYNRRYGVGKREKGFLSEGHGTLKKGQVDYIDPDTGTISVDGELLLLSDIGAINRSIVESEGTVHFIDSESLQKAGETIPYREPFEEGELAIDVGDPRSISNRISRFQNALYYLGGSRGFLTRVLLGDDDYGEGTAMLETADKAFSYSGRFWSGSMGGRGGGLSEVFRRAYQKRPGLTQEVNELPNIAPRWLPKQYWTGDPYASIPGGEYRLPGEAYESLHTLHPDKYGTYGAVDRAAILADVAPWSDEFRLWLERARSQDISPEAEDFLQQRLEESRKQQKDFHITEYEYLNQNIHRKTATIDRFIDQERFLIEGSDQVFRMAGVYGTMNVEEKEGQAAVSILGEYMSPGQEVTLITPEHNRGTVPAVVQTEGGVVNKMLRNAGLTPRDEGSNISSYIETGPRGRAVGKAWEMVSHSRIPLMQNKILNVNSPLEHYKYKNIYGKDFQSWGRPIDDLIKPTFQSAAAQHPVGAGATGAFAGFLIGSILGGTGVGKQTAKIGAAVGGGLSIWKRAKEFETGEAWIPEDTRVQREIEQYIDRIKYIKNKRLFKKYAEVAEKKEDVDIDEIIFELEKKYEEIKAKERDLESYSKYISTHGVPSDKSVRKIITDEGRIQYSLTTEQDYINMKREEINKRLAEISDQEILAEIGPYAQKALEYRERYQSTMVALDESSTYQEIFKALPRNEREYFSYFSQEFDPDKQREILKLVPDDLERIYKQVWGKDTEHPDTKEELKEYFQNYALPDSEWVGWKEGVDLEHSQIKLTENEGFDPKDFGLWKNFTEEEMLTPAPVKPGEDFRKTSISSTIKLKRKLKEIMEEYDIEDIEIEIEPSKDKGLTLDIDIEQDVTDKVKNRVRAAMGGI